MKETVRQKDGGVIEVFTSEGKLHRENGPAWTYESPDGTKISFYFNNGVLERKDGAAISVEFNGRPAMDDFYDNGRRVAPFKHLAPK